MEVIRCISTFLMWLPLDGRAHRSFCSQPPKSSSPLCFCFVTEQQQQLTDAQNLSLHALWTFIYSSLMIFRPLRGIFLRNDAFIHNYKSMGFQYMSHMTESESFNETYNDDSSAHTNYQLHQLRFSSFSPNLVGVAAA